MDERMPTAALARLAPPPGGERRLRAALRGREADRRGWRLPLAAAFASLCVLAVTLLLRPDPADARIRGSIARALDTTDEVRVAGTRVERVAGLDPAVHVYRLAGEPALSPAAGR